MFVSSLRFNIYKYFSKDISILDKNPPEIKINIVNDEDQITLLLGMDSKYLFRNFKYNNIQLTNTWYFDHIHYNTVIIAKQILKYSPSTINIIGTSKSCNGAFILSSYLASIFPKIKFRLFLFSPYTFYDKKFFKEFGLQDRLPPTLVKLMDNTLYKRRLQRYGDSKKLINKQNIYPYVIYPKRSHGGENIMASRLYGIKNATFLPLPLTTHSLIHPFWKKIDANMEIEIFESTKKKLPIKDFEWFNTLQNYPNYDFNIYNLVFDTENFIPKINEII